MKASTFLRIAAVITFLFFLGHTSGIPWTPGEAPADAAVIEAMRSDHFQVLGVSRSYWDFYYGWGLLASVVFLGSAILLWQIGFLAKTDAPRLRPIIAVFFLGFVANTVIALIYFFAIPLVMSAIITLCLALAFTTAGKRDA
ncbi:MAG: hypothetical protein ABI999_12675 [Acidobacteriota bacterium]